MGPAQKKIVRFKVDGREYEGTDGESLLGALRYYGYRVPSLCHHEAVSPYGACRLCLVEVGKGRRRKLTTSCNYPVGDGIEVFLDTEKVTAHRKMVISLLLAEAPGAKAVLELAEEYGVAAAPFPPAERDGCIRCGLCVRVCKEIVGAEAIGFAGRGLGKAVEVPWRKENEACIACGACAYICPTKCIDLSDEGGIRRLPRWRREIPLERCSACGRPIAPSFQLDAFARSTGTDRRRLETCVDCRGGLTGKPARKAAGAAR